MPALERPKATTGSLTRLVRACGMPMPEPTAVLRTVSRRLTASSTARRWCGLTFPAETSRSMSSEMACQRSRARRGWTGSAGSGKSSMFMLLGKTPLKKLYGAPPHPALFPDRGEGEKQSRGFRYRQHVHHETQKLKYSSNPLH